jgi:hypothetical protein
MSRGFLSMSIEKLLSEQTWVENLAALLKEMVKWKVVD